MPDIFLSYAHEDQEAARRLAAALERKGWSVWWDTELLPGQEFSGVIKDALLDSSCVVVLWSTHSITAERPWVRAEAQLGHRKGVLVQATIGELEPPLPFNAYHSVDIAPWLQSGSRGEFERLIRGIEEKLAQRTAAPPNATTAAPTHRSFFWLFLLVLGLLGLSIAVGITLRRSALPPIVTVFSILAIAYCVYWLFKTAEDTLDREIVQSISRYMQGLEPDEHVKNVPAGFLAAFDAVFGPRMWSWKRILRSAGASVIGVMLFGVMVLSTHSELRRMFFVHASGGFLSGLDTLYRELFVPVFLTLNLVPDFVSLAESRTVIKWMAQTPSIAVVPLLALDLVFTLLIFAIPLALWWGSPSKALQNVLECLFLPVRMGEQSNVNIWYVRIFLFTTLLTSIWVWLYALSGLFVRGTGLFEKDVAIVARWFRKDQPLRALGLISSLIMAFGLVCFIAVSGGIRL